MSDLVRSTVEEGEAVDPPKRDFYDVIARVIALVPAKHPDLKLRLEKIRDDAGFQPPESNEHWRKLVERLTDYFPQGPTEPWSQEIARVVNGQ